MHFHPEMFISCDQFGVLRLRHLNVAGRLAQMLARQGRGGQVPQMRRRSQQHIRQSVGFIAKAKALQRRGAAFGVAPLQAERVFHAGLRRIRHALRP